MLCDQALSRQEDDEFNVADGRTVVLLMPCHTCTSLRYVDVFAFSGTISTGGRVKGIIIGP